MAAPRCTERRVCPFKAPVCCLGRGPGSGGLWEGDALLLPQDFWEADWVEVVVLSVVPPGDSDIRWTHPKLHYQRQRVCKGGLFLLDQVPQSEGSLAMGGFWGQKRCHEELEAWMGPERFSVFSQGQHSGRQREADVGSSQEKPFVPKLEETLPA